MTETVVEDGRRPNDGADGPALPTIADLHAARRRLAGAVLTTPLVSAPLVDQRIGPRVGRRLLIKAESLQPTGAFKIRGATNAVACLSEAARRRGLIAYSSGNHAQAVAAAAVHWGVSATIVMPADAPVAKRAATERWGAKVVTYDRATQSREAIATQLAAETGAALIKPYDDAAIIAGQGTIGLEIVEQLTATADGPPSAVLVPTSGGGLAAGIAVAIADHWPQVPIYSVEPAGFDDTARSLRTGTRVANPQSAGSVCDALLVQQPGALTFALNQRLLAGGIAVSDHDALRAVAVAARDYRLVLEPGGAVGLAAAMDEAIVPLLRGAGPVVVIGSGGNIDPPVLAQALGM